MHQRAHHRVCNALYGEDGQYLIYGGNWDIYQTQFPSQRAVFRIRVIYDERLWKLGGVGVDRNQTSIAS